MMNKRRKLIAVAATTAITLGALAGCSTGGSGGDGDKVTLTWWHNGTGEPLLSYWEGVAADFEKTTPTSPSRWRRTRTKSFSAP